MNNENPLDELLESKSLETVKLDREQAIALRARYRAEGAAMELERQAAANAVRHAGGVSFINNTGIALNMKPVDDKPGTWEITASNSPVAADAGGLSPSAGLSAADITKLGQYGAEVLIMQKNATIKAHQSVLADRDAEIAELRRTKEEITADDLPKAWGTWTEGDQLLTLYTREQVLELLAARPSAVMAEAQSDSVPDAIVTAVQKYGDARADGSPFSAKAIGEVIREIRTYYGAPHAASWAEEDVRKQISDALGMQSDRSHRFAWSYLIGSVQQCAEALEAVEDAQDRATAMGAARQHNEIMNLPIPIEPKIPADAGVMLAYKLGHRDARHAAAELVAGMGAGLSDGAAYDLLAEIVKEAEANFAAIRRAGGFVDEGILVERARVLLKARPTASGAAALSSLRNAHVALQLFKRDWGTIPFPASKLDKRSRESIAAALSHIVNLDAVGGPLDLSKYDRPAATGEKGGAA